MLNWKLKSNEDKNQKGKKTEFKKDLKESDKHCTYTDSTMRIGVSEKKKM